MCSAGSCIAAENGRFFSSLRANDSGSAILNLEQGDGVPHGGRLVLHVTGVDALWAHLRENGSYWRLWIHCPPSSFSWMRQGVNRASSPVK
jgi:hypothetical protein